MREAEDPRFEEMSAEIELLLAEGSNISEPSLCAVAAGGNITMKLEGNNEVVMTILLMVFGT